MEKILSITQQFALPERPISVSPLGAGFINDTYLVDTQKTIKYILQRKNASIFKNIPGLVDNICQVTQHIKKKAMALRKDPERSALTLYPALDGKFYYVDDEQSYWVCMYFIPNTQCFETASSPALAYSGGVGIGQFQQLLSDFTHDLAEVLPGFHDIRYRFLQWDNALIEDRAARVKELALEIDWIEQRRDEMLTFKKLIEEKTIPPRVSHNDTKISNILFDQKGEVLCMIDLDTLMKSSVLYDYGDAIRSYTNTSAEDEVHPERVGMHPEFFKEFSRGYLSYTHHFLTEPEVLWLAFAAKYITFEQVLRFLMDYINGDRYYKIAYPTHNLIRTHAQYALLLSMEKVYPAMQDTVSEIYLSLRFSK